MIEAARRMMDQRIEKLRGRFSAMVTRAVMSTISDAANMQQITVKTLGNHVRSGEHFQPAGLSSNPSAGEGLAFAVMGQDDHTVVLCMSNRAKRPKGLLAGESALYGEAGPLVLCDVAGNVILGETIATQAAALAVSIASKVATELEALKLTVNTHTHAVAGITAGAASVFSATGLPQHGAIGDTASANVKAKP